MEPEGTSEPQEGRTERKTLTRAQVLAAQALLRRTKRGYGKDTPEIRRIAAGEPVD